GLKAGIDLHTKSSEFLFGANAGYVYTVVGKTTNPNDKILYQFAFHGVSYGAYFHYIYWPAKKLGFSASVNSRFYTLTNLTPNNWDYIDNKHFLILAGTIGVNYKF